MTGGQGCQDQGTGGSSDKGHWNWTTPKHCPGMTDAEYRTEASMYAVVASPMMVGTDIRLMTPIMKVHDSCAVFTDSVLTRRSFF